MQLPANRVFIGGDPVALEQSILSFIYIYIYKKKKVYSIEEVISNVCEKQV